MTSTLNGGIDGSVTTLVVTSATDFPSAPIFRLLIDNERFLVTGRSGTTFTVVRGVDNSSAVSHANGANIWYLPPTQSGVLNAKALGAKGDGVTDDAVNLNAGLRALRRNETLYLPSGKYIVGSELTFGVGGVNLKGDGRTAFGTWSGGTEISGNFAGRILNLAAFAETGGGLHTITDLSVVNTHAAGYGIHIEALLTDIERVNVSAWRAIWAPQFIITLSLRQIYLSGIPDLPTGSIGLLAGGHVGFFNADVVGFEEGVRMYGGGNAISQARIEVNKTGIVLGKDSTGATHSLSASHLSGINFEANDASMLVNSITASTLTAIQMMGTSASPSGQSTRGLHVAFAQNSEFSDINVTGGYTDFAVRDEGGSHTYRNVVAGNVLSKPAWDIKNALRQIIFENCNYTHRPGDATAEGRLYQPLVITHTMRAINHIKDAVEGRNFGQNDVAVTETATTHQVTFPTGATVTTADIATATAAAGGSLANGTYYHRATLVTPHGETDSLTEKTTVLAGGNGTVTMTYNATTTTRYRRRLYRGTATDVYDGYIEGGLNSDTLNDTGQALTRRKSPPLTGDNIDPDMAEADADYGVIITPSWLTTWKVTGKATTGLLVTFGTAAPAGASFDYLIFRT